MYSVGSACQASTGAPSACQRDLSDLKKPRKAPPSENYDENTVVSHYLPSDILE